MPSHRRQPAPKPPGPPPPIRGAYDTEGPEAFYANKGATYRNPHEPVIRTALADLAPTLDLSHILDLAAGSGEATLALRDLGAQNIDAIDPYTAAAYTTRTGSPCEALSFEQIADGALAGRTYTLVVCSFALHLLAESRLPAFCAALAEVAPTLLILTPHKRPNLREEWGWQLADERTYTSGEPDHLRCRARLYTSPSPSSRVGR